MKPIVTPCLPDAGTVRGMIYALKGRYFFLDALPFGRSVLGRELYALTLGTGSKRVLYAAAFHGQEWITSLLLLRLCEELCVALQKDGCLLDIDLRRALYGRSLVLVPTVNPDGVEIALHGADAAQGYADAVRQMGGDTPGLWQANVCGVDLNRNYDAGWREAKSAAEAQGVIGPGPRRYGGSAPNSEPETQAMLRLCKLLEPRHVLALHAQGEEIYWQYGTATPSRSRIMAEVMAASSGYAVAQPESIASHAGFKDWFIETYRRPGFTLECGKGENPLPLSDFEPLYARLRELLLLTALM